MHVERLNDDQRLEIRTLRKIGQQALEKVQYKAELDLMGDSKGQLTDTQEFFLLTVRDVALKLYVTEALTPRGVGLWMLHPNTLLSDFTPLDMCIAGEPVLALEAAQCFADSERPFGDQVEGLAGRLNKAVTYLDQ